MKPHTVGTGRALSRATISSHEAPGSSPEPAAHDIHGSAPEQTGNAATPDRGGAFGESGAGPLSSTRDDLSLAYDEPRHDVHGGGFDLDPNWVHCRRAQ